MSRLAGGGGRRWHFREGGAFFEFRSPAVGAQSPAVPCALVLRRNQSCDKFDQFESDKGFVMDVNPAHDGESARRTAGWGADFDCVLPDLELPDCDGPDLLAGLRLRPECVAQSASGLALVWMLDRGEVTLRTINQARELAEALAKLCPDPKAARGALQELLVNAIEHGNLEIDYATKTELMLEDRWQDEIDQRLQDPRFRDRVVKLAFRRDAGMLECVISDDGPGFDWQPYLELSGQRAFDPNGRGIAIAARQVDELIFSGRGNVVTVRCQLKRAGANGGNPG